jgi:hypothetical protein
MELSSIYLKIFDSLPLIAFVVDDDVCIKYFNTEAMKVVKKETLIYDKRGGEVLNCIHHREHEQGCGYADACKDCIIRNSVNEAAQGKQTYKKQAELRIVSGDTEALFHALITTTPFTFDDQNLYILMIENINEIVQLKEMIPICSNCKRIRDDKDYWVAVEEYITNSLETDFTYSLCPDCVHKLYPNLDDIKKRNKQKRE